MNATMMHTPMSVRMIMDHGATVFPDSLVGTFDGSAIAWASYRDVARNAARLAGALAGLGVRPGDRVGTFCWNNRAHMEAYLAVPCMGAVLHTVNVRLAPEQVAYVINHAEDRVLIVDGSLRELFAPVVPLLKTVQHVVLVGAEPDLPGVPSCSTYQAELAARPDVYDWPVLDEVAAAAVCYTSGTTGNPKGVVYSHRTTFVHSLASRAADTFGISERDRILLLPPMFHANAWGLPYSGWLSGSDFVLPGPHLQLDGIREMVRQARPTFSAMVPTILGDLLRASRTGSVDMTSFRMLVCGGSAVPPAMIDAARAEWGVPVLQGWGMTETSPLCALSHPPRDPGDLGETRWRAKSGRPVPGVEVRVVDDAGGSLARDGATVGELQLRGPWVTGAYHGGEGGDAFTADGWLRTGDVGHIDEKHFVQLTDRTKDVIKSGGEWISSVELENVLAAHPDVVEAAVIAVADERWQERPLAIVVRARDSLSAQELREFLDGRVARFWIPEYWAFPDAIVKTSVGKFDKRALRAIREAGGLLVEYVK
ncbi:MAG: long-chain fatty acid--CoA ligase [Deltaproteobacteria bacterium]|nr:long-chain fatty acid--CoA ligase [Deltaproteobacteria bacterium]